MSSLVDPVADLTNQMGRMQLATWKEESVKKSLNVHRDDVHALLKAQNHFYSGSKDGTVQCWDFEGKKVKDITGFKSIDYRRWVTAMASCGKESFVVGYRDGLVELYNQNGDLTNSIQPQGNSQGQHGFSKANGYVCKDRNQDRVTCLTDYTDYFGKRSFFIGLPSSFKLVDHETGNTIVSQKIHANDWVYCVNPIAVDRLSIVIGSTLDIWNRNKDDTSWDYATTLVKEVVQGSSSSKELQRPHISSVQPLENATILALTDFKGDVKVVDIETGKLFRRFSEHQGRAWHVIELQPFLLASGADDRLVKIWDSRSRKSVLTLGNHPGRVSQLLSINNTTFIAASCPDNVRESVNKAEFTIRDLRK